MTIQINKATIQVVSGPPYVPGIAVNKATVQVVSGPPNPNGGIVLNKATLQVVSVTDAPPPRPPRGWTPKITLVMT